ncbi:protein kinase family protein [Planococcus sp. ISL-110]|uniref:protein kinase family protein n=1 Tax=Planococcus sp. ISL-110 TaxID=2819167 RepID=UPI001BEAADBF|nr:protein kinase family protein [Planococcus sp. ISL-110]MBT2571482.1 protein kinase family protein [Planococcus sp. ISL-110]
MAKKVEFDAIKKQFILVRPLGSGGTGDTHLLKDETTDMFFAFKKYVPKDSNFIDENYERFVDEIKILFNLSHPNVVRVYNYYLYPQKKTGYLQMEYIEGDSIEEFETDPFGGKTWSDIFIETIAAFEYLESNNVLHRDIRPANIMIDKHENVKVIDFGFGKKLEGLDQDAKSVFLNWPVTQLPYETEYDGIYNRQSEIYFVGKLLANVIDRSLDNFNFEHIIEKMIKIDPKKRYKSFHDISIDISKGVFGEIDFTNEEKEVYRKFADTLSIAIKSYWLKYDPIRDDSEILNNLIDLIRITSLEKILQDNSQLTNCFIQGRYTYSTKHKIEVSIITDFYRLLVGLSPFRRRIVLDNIDARLSVIKVEVPDDDLPF